MTILTRFTYGAKMANTSIEIDGLVLEKNHIFPAILTVQNALLGLHRTPADVIRAREMELKTKKRYGGRGIE